ncbi:MAG: DUF3995 domain-containing protein [Paracoccaceae bacterium]
MWSIAVGVFVVLACVSGLHVYWGQGGLWPAKSEAELVKTVVGSPKFDRLPPAVITYGVAVLIFAAALMPGLHLMQVFPDALSRAALWVLVVVFLGRGAVTYCVPPVFNGATEPFRSLNIRYFSPLCLMLGVGYLVFALYS